MYDTYPPVNDFYVDVESITEDEMNDLQEETVDFRDILFTEPKTAVSDYYLAGEGLQASYEKGDVKMTIHMTNPQPTIAGECNAMKPALFLWDTES